MASKAVKKMAYDKKLCQLLDEYTQILIAAVGNVGSNQLLNIRQRLRGDFVFLMGKNTIMKRSIRIHAEKTGNTAFLIQIPVLAGNVGLISTKGNLKEVSEEVAKYKVKYSVPSVVHYCYNYCPGSKKSSVSSNSTGSRSKTAAVPVDRAATTPASQILASTPLSVASPSTLLPVRVLQVKCIYFCIFAPCIF
ncbi:hypothetical protein RHSIM_Rhsim09G0173300 [Rhododendron simsii]|uniref:Uncharacterized protein n=1 Tax=Rhododendron simsii TaxID=118357 RepID=A0A834GKE5_RHOSS|nr:hypothetical protein RHSIM_Rhsim09G0173300 [Rhododendron simsii]